MTHTVIDDVVSMGPPHHLPLLTEFMANERSGALVDDEV